jgi:hypothetical protein
MLFLLSVVAILVLVNDFRKAEENTPEARKARYEDEMLDYQLKQAEDSN